MELEVGAAASRQAPCGDREPDDDARFPKADADVDHLATRSGPFAPTYDPDFLGFRVDVPHDEAGDSLEVEGSVVIPYTHFCLALSASRRLARWVAWNIDGSSMKTTERVDFYTERRLTKEQQVLNKAYLNNELDRGHVARRADLIWGPDEEAIRANNQSFAYPNITPQMVNFNQSDECGLWGELEDAVLHRDTLQGGRLSVIGGPFPDPEDPPYRDGYVQLPKAFFKIVIYVMEGELRTRAFILDQNFDGLRPAWPLDGFRIAPVPVSDVARRAALRFDDSVTRADRAPSRRSAVPAKRRFIENASDVVW